MDRFLFCLGVTKGGTTWLNWVLNRHPGIARIPRKELHFFLRQYGQIDRLSDYARMKHFSDFVEKFSLAADDDPRGMLERGAAWDDAQQSAWQKNGESRRKYRRLMKMTTWYRQYLKGPVNEDWYRSLFDAVPAHQWPSDFSTTGLICGEAGIAAMAGFAPDSRAIVILRNPIDRLWSHAKFHAQVTGKIDELATWDADRIVYFVEKFEMPNLSYYSPGVEAMLKHFAPDKRLIIDFADIASRPQGLLNDVLGLLDLAPMDLPMRDPDDPRINVSPSIPMPPGVFSKYCDSFVADLERLKSSGIDFVDPWIAATKEHRQST